MKVHRRQKVLILEASCNVWQLHTLEHWTIITMCAIRPLGFTYAVIYGTLSSRGILGKLSGEEGAIVDKWVSFF